MATGANNSSLNFNESGQFTNAFVELYKKRGIGLGRLNEVLFEEDFAQRIKEARVFKKEEQKWCFETERWCIDTMRGMLISRVAIDAEKKFLDTTFLGLIKKVREWVAHRLFNRKTSFDEANKLLSNYRKLLNCGKDSSDEDTFIGFKEKLGISDPDFQKLRKQAEFEAEILMAQRCAIIGNRTFQYEVGPANNKRVIFVAPNGEIDAVGAGFQILVDPENGDAYKVDLSHCLGTGSQALVYAGTGGSVVPERCGPRAVSYSKTGPATVEEAFRAGNLIKQAHKNNRNSGVIELLRIFKKKLFGCVGKPVDHLLKGINYEYGANETAIQIMPQYEMSLGDFIDNFEDNLFRKFSANLVKSTYDENVLKSIFDFKGSYDMFLKHVDAAFDLFIKNVRKEIKDEKVIGQFQSIYNSAIKKKSTNAFFEELKNKSTEFGLDNTLKSSFDALEKKLREETEALLKKNKPLMKDKQKSESALNILFGSSFAGAIGNLLKEEYASEKDIFMKFCEWKLKHKKAFIISLVKAIKQLHDEKIIHRDLKPKNILLRYDPEKDEFELVVADLGLAVLAEGETHLELRNTPAGTPGYVAPEVLQKPTILDMCRLQANPDLKDVKWEAQPKNDIWSLGLICFEILTGTPVFTLPPFNEYEAMRLNVKISQNKVDAGLKQAARFLEDEEKALLEFIRPMLNLHPDERSSAAKLEARCEALLASEPLVVHGKGEKPAPSPLDGTTIPDNSILIPDAGEPDPDYDE